MFYEDAIDALVADFTADFPSRYLGFRLGFGHGFSFLSSRNLMFGSTLGSSLYQQPAEEDEAAAWALAYGGPAVPC